MGFYLQWLRQIIIQEEKISSSFGHGKRKSNHSEIWPEQCVLSLVWFILLFIFIFIFWERDGSREGGAEGDHPKQATCPARPRAQSYNSKFLTWAGIKNWTQHGASEANHNASPLTKTYLQGKLLYQNLFWISRRASRQLQFPFALMIKEGEKIKILLSS